MDLRAAVGSVVNGPLQSSAPPKAPVESQTLPSIRTVKDFWMSTGPTLAQGRANLGQLAYGISPKKEFLKQ